MTLNVAQYGRKLNELSLENCQDIPRYHKPYNLVLLNDKTVLSKKVRNTISRGAIFHTKVYFEPRTIRVSGPEVTKYRRKMASFIVPRSWK